MAGLELDIRTTVHTRRSSEYMLWNHLVGLRNLRSALSWGELPSNTEAQDMCLYAWDVLQEDISTQ